MQIVQGIQPEIIHSNVEFVSAQVLDINVHMCLLLSPLSGSNLNLFLARFPSFDVS